MLLKVRAIRVLPTSSNLRQRTESEPARQVGRACVVLEDCGRRPPAGKQSPESHDIAHHGNGTDRADNEYWNQSIEL